MSCLLISASDPAHGGAYSDPHRGCKEGLMLLKLFVCVVGFASVDFYVPESMGMLTI